MPARPLPASPPVMAPSMLKVDYADLADEVRRLEAADAAVLHWDVMDGNFVPNLSYGAMVIASVRPRTKLFFDAHLMIADPAKYLDDYVQAGCDAITVHIEAVPEPLPLLERIHGYGLKAGLAINPKTPVEKLRPALSTCDLVLVMSVEPGFGGQKFMSGVLPKLKELRTLVRPETVLSIDGGIGPATIAEAAAAGAQWFVAGSSIFDQPDYAAAMRHMESLAKPHMPR
jgi:ribulose-phosphate 3-epimerase